MKSQALVVVVVLVSGCASTHLEDPVSVTTTTGGVSNTPGGVDPSQGMPNTPAIVVLGDDAAGQIASVRCTHEAACGNVGTYGTFESFDVCVAEVRRANRQQLTGSVCPQGVDPYALERCIDDVRLQPACGETPKTCGSPSLCRR